MGGLGGPHAAHAVVEGGGLGYGGLELEGPQLAAGGDLEGSARGFVKLGRSLGGLFFFLVVFGVFFHFLGVLGGGGMSPFGCLKSGVSPLEQVECHQRG